MNDPQARFEELSDKLRRSECRLTPQRLALLRLLASSEQHPSAAQLYDTLKVDYPTMSPGTVYKTLALLKELGEVREMGFSNDDNRYDGNRTDPHAHLICVKCRKIIDADFCPVNEMAAEFSTRTNFKILGHRVDIYGLCPDCQREAEGRSE